MALSENNMDGNNTILQPSSAANKVVHVAPKLRLHPKISQVLWDTVLTSSSSAIPARREDRTGVSSAVSWSTRVSTIQNEPGSLTRVGATVEITASHKVTVKQLRKVALELIKTGRWLHSLVLKLQQTALSGHGFGWESEQTIVENIPTARKQCPQNLIHKMGRTVGYPLKPLLVIYLLRATLLCFISEEKKRGNDKVLQLCLFIKNRVFLKAPF